MPEGPDLKTILAIKVKRAREERRLTLTELAQKAALSISYLAEIEAGRKYPKPERILALAEALNCPYDDLISTKIDRDVDELHTFLSAPAVRDFPFELFGLSAADLMKLLTKAPAESSALLRALNGIAREYNIGVEAFLHAALRSYQELTGNYYPEIEREAEAFGRTLLAAGKGPWDVTTLRTWVTAKGVPEIDERVLGRARPCGASGRCC